MSNQRFCKSISKVISDLEINLFFIFVLASLLLVYPNTAYSSGGVTGYTGNVSNSGAGVAAGNGNSAEANLRLEFNINKYVAVGIYNESGTIDSPLFSSPTENFPNGATFAADQSVLVSNEMNTASKFDLDGVNSIEDQTKIIDAMNLQSDVKSDDIYIKGAVYTNMPVSNSIVISTDKDSVTLTGGTGSAPVYNFRCIAGVPGFSNSKSQAPFTTPVGIANKRNDKGFARFAIVGDLDESSVDITTDGIWTSSITIIISEP